MMTFRQYLEWRLDREQINKPISIVTILDEYAEYRNLELKRRSRILKLKLLRI